MKELDELPQMLTVKELKEFLRIGQRQAYRLCRRKNFPAIRVNGNSIRIPRHGLEEWLREKMETGSEDDLIDYGHLRES